MRSVGYVIKNRISKHVNNICIIVVQFVRHLKESIKIYAKCKHLKCKKFVIVLRDRCVEVYSPSANYCHVQMLTSYVKGVERSITKKKLQRRKPSQLKKDIVINLNKKLIKMGNLQSIKSDCVFRKIRSEGKSEWDRDSNDILDLIQMQMSHREYITEISFPFSVKLFSKEQILLADNEKKR